MRRVNKFILPSWGLVLISLLARQGMETRNLADETKILRESVTEVKDQRDIMIDRFEKRAGCDNETIDSLQNLIQESIQEPVAQLTIINVEFEPIEKIPLSYDIQYYTYGLCDNYDVPYELVLSVMEVETNFENMVIMDTNGYYSYGYMMVSDLNRSKMDGLGIDLDSEKGRIEAGVYILSDYYHRYDLGTALAAYNAGQVGMKRGEGRRYADKVLNVYNRY